MEGKQSVVNWVKIKMITKLLHFDKTLHKERPINRLINYYEEHDVRHGFSTGLL